MIDKPKNKTTRGVIMEKMMGVMLDCSRNAVMRVESVKKYAEIIKKMGYNTLMLYTEDTYEVNNQPLFGHLRGRYSKKELKEIDAYCNEIGIELIPCIQTLAHISSIFKWENVYDEVNDCDDILLVGEEKTYKLIEDMISTISEVFTTRKIHIGMDEAYRVGQGKYEQLHGIRDRFDIINEHLHKVCEITEKYGMKPMIWNDMFVKLALDIKDQYVDSDNSKITEKASLPAGVSLVYWDYYSTDYERYARMIETTKLFKREVYFAGGAWTWNGFAPDNDYSIKATKAAIEACNDCGVDGMFFTVWGDDGAECSKFAVLPALMYAAEKAEGNDDLNNIKAKFKTITGCEFDDFLLFDKLDTPGGKHRRSASKYIFYNDLFLGVRDCLCSENDGVYYANLEKELHNVCEKGSFELLFDTYEKFASLLKIKAALGLKMKKAYRNRDTEALKNIIDDCDVLTRRVKEFHKLHQKRWFEENKPHGFDVQDLRIGGLLQRIASCKERLMLFVGGETDEIPELAEPDTDNIFGKHNIWCREVSPNVISHAL